MIAGFEALLTLGPVRCNMIGRLVRQGKIEGEDYFDRKTYVEDPMLGGSRR
jgi:hypothetical protein